MAGAQADRISKISVRECPGNGHVDILTNYKVGQYDQVMAFSQLSQDLYNRGSILTIAGTP